MRTMRNSALFLCLIILNVLTSVSRAETPVPASAEETNPIKKGEKLKSARVREPDGSAKNILDVIAAAPTVLVLYRGGWCPYCNTQLSGLADIDDELRAMGFQVVAASPDRPEKLGQSIKERNLPYKLFSDSKMELAKALGVAFKLDDETFKKYKEQYGIDIEKDSGENHHLLPVPTVLILNKKGEVQFVYTNPDYKVRLDTAKLLAEAKQVSK